MTTRSLTPKIGLLLAAALVLAAAAWAVIGMERTVRNGQVVLVPLAPVDPRSLMQGDYMALGFAIDRQLPRRSHDKPMPRYAYLRLDAQTRATYGSTGDTLPAPPGHVALRLRWPDWRASVGPNAFFFQEGQGEVYARAAWGELRVADDGTALLVALRDADLKILGANATLAEPSRGMEYATPTAPSSAVF